MFQALTIARTTFIESLRQPVLLILVLLSGIFQVFNTWNTGFAMAQEEAAEIAGDTKLLFDIGLATVFVCGTLLAGFLATAALSSEIENKTVLTIVSKPVSRTTLILGKYLGVSGAILIASFTMLLFLLFGIRHGVMSTAADDLDQPVLLFSVGTTFLVLGLAAWCNYFYGWSFPQTGAVLLFPFLLVGYILTLAINKKWQLQGFAVDFKPQVTLACLCLLLAILLLSAIALAASTRLGRVMTIVTCLGVFVASLLSNHLIGRYVFTNRPIAVVSSAAPIENAGNSFLAPGEYYDVRLENAPDATIRPGDSFYYSPTPNGVPLIPNAFPPFTGDLNDANQVIGPDAVPGVLVTRVEGQSLRIRNVGPLASTGKGVITVPRPPEEGDYIFQQPTKTNYAAMALWGILPNVQHFWLLDAVSQHRSVPAIYIQMSILYAACQIIAFLALAVILFEHRDVG